MNVILNTDVKLMEPLIFPHNLPFILFYLTGTPPPTIVSSPNCCGATEKTEKFPKFPLSLFPVEITSTIETSLPVSLIRSQSRLHDISQIRKYVKGAFVFYSTKLKLRVCHKVVKARGNKKSAVLLIHSFDSALC